MDRFNFSYSMKAIPMPSKSEYQRTLVGKVESCTRRMRWKLWHTRNPGRTAKKETFGFSTPETPPAMEEMRQFETEFFEIVNKIEYRPYSNSFQQKLKTDLERIKKTDRIIVSADKTSNKYLLNCDEYRKLMQEKVTAEYTKDRGDILKNIDEEAAKIMKEFEISDRIDRFQAAEPFITVKDHKPSWPGRAEVRFVNPAKSNIGVVSKKILDKKLAVMRTKLGVTQWKSTGEVLKWFDGLGNKGRLRFFKFDIINYYPSINEALYSKALELVKQVVGITEDELKVLWNARKAVVVKGGEIWTKKSAKNFDVTIGSYDGAEVCEMVGLFMLQKLKEKFPEEEMGLYRNDGLMATGKSGPQTSRLEKDMHVLFKDEGLKITTEANLVKTEFLDVLLDLETGTRRPYRKPGDKPRYVHQMSNHPPAVKKQMPIMVERRISDLSSTKELFEEEKEVYQEALNEAGYKHKLEFKQSSRKQNRNRQRRTIWFNPPWNEGVSTNLTQLFRRLIRKHFPVGSELSRVFNVQNLRLSYCCTRNMESIVSAHNRKLLNTPQQEARMCNCRSRIQCPLDGKCLTSEIVYKAEVTAENTDTKYYIGATESTFKVRLGNHKKSFRHEKYKHETALSSYCWKLREEKVNHSVKWKIMTRAKAYTNTSRMCNLCLTEKTLIAVADPTSSLNVREEIIAKCRHRKKWLLSQVGG